MKRTTHRSKLQDIWTNRNGTFCKVHETDGAYVIWKLGISRWEVYRSHGVGQ